MNRMVFRAWGAAALVTLFASVAEPAFATDVSSTAVNGINSNIGTQLQDALSRRIAEGQAGPATGLPISAWSSTDYVHSQQPGQRDNFVMQTFAGDVPVGGDFHLGLAAGPTYEYLKASALIAGNAFTISGSAGGGFGVPYAYYVINNVIGIYGFLGYDRADLAAHITYASVPLNEHITVEQINGGVGVTTFRQWGAWSLIGVAEYDFTPTTETIPGKTATSGGTTATISQTSASYTVHSGILSVQAGYNIDRFTPYLRVKGRSDTTDGSSAISGTVLDALFTAGATYRFTDRFSGDLEVTKNVNSRPDETEGTLNLRFRF